MDHQQYYKKTYQRKNKQLNKIEIMGYGGDSRSMNIEHFRRKSAYYGSVFGMQVLSLQEVCWMDPRTFMENIPKSWASVDVAIYHCYRPGCNMDGAHINILVAS